MGTSIVWCPFRERQPNWYGILGNSYSKESWSLNNKAVMKILFVAALLLVAESSASGLVDSKGMSTVSHREKKQLGAFAIVTFKNEECQATSTTTMQGVCFSSTECSNKGGKKDGNCAAGFGVCCTFTVDSTSGGNVNQNITYLQNNGYPSAITTASQTITYTINACSDDICFLRFDFISNTLPQTTTTATGVCLGAFTVTSPTGTNPPAICGNNANYHMYSDVGRSSSATTVAVTTGTGSTSRTWKVKVSQIECTNPNKPPSGCTQYYTASSGTIESYNFNGGLLPTGLAYTICFKANAGACGMSYAVDQGTTTPNPFCLPTSGTPNAQTGAPTTAPCTTNPNARTVACQEGRIEISGVPGTAGTGTYCGTKLNNIAATGTSLTTSSGTIVTEGVPFQVAVVSVGSDVKGSTGFKINYTQRSAC